jgi:His-Xaa-Ser system protein HxsD
LLATILTLLTLLIQATAHTILADGKNVTTEALDSRGQLSATISFSSAVHKLEAVKKAAYRFSRFASVSIHPDDQGFTCTLNFHSQVKQAEVATLLRDFEIEVLDQGLRESIAEETGSIRNTILAHVFSKTGLQSSE